MNEGTRIRLTAMPDDPHPIPVGTCGTVVSSTDFGSWSQVQVNWDNGRRLRLSVPPDTFEVIEGSSP